MACQGVSWPKQYGVRAKVTGLLFFALGITNRASLNKREIRVPKFNEEQKRPHKYI